MERDNALEGLNDLLTRRRRRLRIGDLLAAVALLALGLFAVRVPDVTGGMRPLVGLLTTTFLGLILAQWGMAGISFRRPRPIMNAFLGVLSPFFALSAFVGVVVLGFLAPGAAAVVSVTALLLVVYMTTWD
jgi:hypothetical protein